MALLSSSAPSFSADARDRSGIGGQPRGLTNLFLTEMWERFSFYGMRALLILFMTSPVVSGGLGFDTKRSAIIYGNYTMSVYLLTILGGFIADNFIGARRSVLIGGIVIACGHFAMAFASLPTFYFGLLLIVVGTGLLKPNVSTMVGGLYAPGDDRRDAGFSIFYMGINLGALLSPFITGWLAQSDEFRSLLQRVGINPLHSWHFGFAAAGVGMSLGVISYVRRRASLVHIGLPPAASAPRPWGKLLWVLAGTAALFEMMTLSDKYPALIYLLFALQIAAILFFGFRPEIESKRLAAILVFFVAAEIFFAIFEQAGSTLSLFADRLSDNVIFGYPFPSAWYQSINSLFVILLAPVFAYVWIKWGAKQPASPAKFVAGLFFLGLSFLLMVPAAKLTALGRVSPLWLVGLFLLQTVGELCLSPVGLSTMTKLAPARLVGLVMGIWFLAAALGNKLAGTLAGEFTSTDPGRLATFFWHQALAVGVFTLALAALVPWVKRLMSGVK